MIDFLFYSVHFLLAVFVIYALETPQHYYYVIDVQCFPFIYSDTKFKCAIALIFTATISEFVP